MSNNTYHLHRHMWNDVHEDWPFYTEQEKQMLKRYEKKKNMNIYIRRLGKLVSL